MSASLRVPRSLIIAAAMVAACGRVDRDVGSRRQYRGDAIARNTSSVVAASPAMQIRANTISTVGGAAFDSSGLALAKDSRAFGVAERKPGRAGSAMAGKPLHGEELSAAPETPMPGSMLVRAGQATLQVDSLEVGISRVREVARRTGSVVANTSMTGGQEEARSASLELRIPSERFDEALTGLAPIGKLESVNVTVQDVGEEYVDVGARMVNAHRLEERLIDLLAKRTGKLSDVLNVEHELARVREEIERYEGRMRYLRSRSSVSTLDIQVHESYPIVAERPGVHPIRDAFAQSWRNFIGVTAGMIATLGVIIPIGVLIGVFLLIGRRFLQTHGLRLPEKASGTPR
ncbi:MAG TPA: DUF4349 domain-containing protein [Gemmatimonadaceae bacterium]|jgi:acetolactate synthase regulatory subunit